tara:strand:+ start:2338 stop:2841 length:504 start_codon:yes stop_codon:yes gene_type:complete
MQPVTQIPFNIDKEKYLEDFYNNFDQVSACFTDGRLRSPKSYFKIIRDTVFLDQETKKWSDFFGADARARYYWIKPNRQLWWHTDAGTKCAINYVLNCNGSRVQFSTTGEDLNGPPPAQYSEFEYRAAILDVTKYHSVPNDSGLPRILFKISIFDKSYEEIVSRLVP